MIFIFGGAYQGKLEYALTKYRLTEDDVFFCSENSHLDFSKKIISGLDRFTFGCVKEGLEAKELLEKNISLLKDKIIIADDVSQGVVPMDHDIRRWREMNGRALIWLGNTSDEVYRIFCGLPQKIK